MKLPYGYQADIKRIKAAGFSHFKVELEADLNRDDDFDNEEYCKRFIRNHCSDAFREALTFDMFYNDGSVDSEYTFTLPIEKAYLAMEAISAFGEMADENGNGLSTGFAGMHLTLLTSGVYPTERLLNAAKLANFTTQVTKLLPALYAAASHDGNTRPMEYRRPTIGPDKDHFPAIHTCDGTALEYRIFDTCYDKPEAILEKIQVIAATLVYFDRKKKVDLKSKQFVMATMADRYSGKQPFSKTVKDTGNLTALKETAKFIKPRSKSLKAFLSERSLDLPQAQVKRFQQAINLRFSLEYENYRTTYIAKVQDYLRRWLRDSHSEISTKDGISAVMPDFERWYRSSIDSQGIKPKPFPAWARGRSVERIYNDVYVTLDLTEPVVTPQRIVEYISTDSIFTWSTNSGTNSGLGDF